MNDTNKVTHVNKIELVGELSKQPEISDTKKGTQVVRFGIKVETGGTKILLWCKAFKELAENLAKADFASYPIGTPIRVLGKLVSEMWGQGKYVDVVWCYDVQFLKPLENIIEETEEKVSKELDGLCEKTENEDFAPF